MKWVFRIGDGHNPTKDLNLVFDGTDNFKPVATELPEDVIDMLGLWGTDEELAIVDGRLADLDNGGVRLIVDEGPDGECDPYAGPWLVASIEPYEEIGE